MKQKTKQISTLIGTAITAACCLGLPIVLSALSIIGLGFLINDIILAPLFVALISFNLWMLYGSLKKNEECAPHSITAFRLAASGGVVSILGLLLSVAGVGFATILIYIGLVLFFIGNFMLYRVDSKVC